MSVLDEVPVAPVSPERFRSILGDEFEELQRAIDTAQSLFEGRVIWHVNSTARGGGVAEMLHSLIAYARGAGVDVRWLTIGGNQEFFRVTKRIHNLLHGSHGDGGSLGPAEREVYEAALQESALALAELIRPGDIVYLHDPQTAGLILPIRNRDMRGVWRCHVGIDRPNDLARRAWAFLLPYVTEADAYVFSRREFVWEGLDADRLWIVPPSIDAFSPKNQDLPPEAVRAILETIGLAVNGGASPVFERQDGSVERVNRKAEVDQQGPIPWEAPLIAQVSRWDRLKDPVGLLRCFAEYPTHPDARLLLAGPSVADVADDPEGAEVLTEVRGVRERLDPELRDRTHLATLPMDDVEENAAMVNAIQRRADVIVQKSLAEGFGLTVAEAMWKARPVVAGRVGGIQDQVVDGESGVLVDGPADLPAVAAAIESLLSDPERAKRIGKAARERIRKQYLGSRHLVQYATLIAELIGDGRTSPTPVGRTAADAR
ncbi:MAG: glycosyltransferase [Solirubrobacterales bacterium]